MKRLNRALDEAGCWLGIAGFTMLVCGMFSAGKTRQEWFLAVIVSVVLYAIRSILVELTRDLPKDKGE